MVPHGYLSDDEGINADEEENEVTGNSCIQTSSKIICFGKYLNLPIGGGRNFQGAERV